MGVHRRWWLWQAIRCLNRNWVISLEWAFTGAGGCDYIMAYLPIHTKARMGVHRRWWLWLHGYLLRKWTASYSSHGRSPALVVVTISLYRWDYIFILSRMGVHQRQWFWLANQVEGGFPLLPHIWIYRPRINDLLHPLAYRIQRAQKKGTQKDLPLLLLTSSTWDRWLRHRSY